MPAATGAHPSHPRPNVLLILVDDMGYGDFGVFSDGSAKTPALDRLVSESLCLTQHYSASAVCAPARAALLTGRYSHRTGAIDTLEGRGLDRLALREATLADRFKAAGYATGLVGKWHLGALDRRYHPNARGFDEFAGFRGGWSDYYQWRLDYNGAFHQADGRYLTDVFTDEAVKFITRHRQDPFFLHVTYNAPHFPFQAPDDVVAPFRDTGQFTTAVSALYGMIARMDTGVGCILDALGEQGLAENTIVLFTSDNGPQFGGVGDDSTARFNAHLRGHKGTVFEGGIRVPAILRWPAGLAGGRQTSAMIHFADWLPTLLAMTGVADTTGAALDGRDVLPLLRGAPDDAPPRRFWQWNRYTPVGVCNAAMRDGDWKLVRPAIREAMQVSPADLAMDRRLKYAPEEITDIERGPEPDRVVPPPPAPLLFNIADDPFEEHDRATAEPARVTAMAHALEGWFEAVDAERRASRADEG
jgi:arylsulfatase A-like enzyme